jgi:UDP-N-acetylglucosamine 2-epimerase
LIIGNSSFGIREASYLGLPAINLGGRQNGRQKAFNVMDLNSETKDGNLASLIEKTLAQDKWFPSSELYGSGNAGSNAARIIKDWNPSIKSRFNG